MTTDSALSKIGVIRRAISLTSREATSDTLDEPFGVKSLGTSAMIGERATQIARPISYSSTLPCFRREDTSARMNQPPIGWVTGPQHVEQIVGVEVGGFSQETAPLAI
jgi:hypothetical protein